MRSDSIKRTVLMLTIALLTTMAPTSAVMAADDAKAETKPKAPAEKPAEKPALKKAANPVVLISTTQGDIYVELFADAAPETVANFIGLAEGTKEFTDPTTRKKVKRPFYDGLIFHRIIKNFMIQGGCPLGTGTGGYKFKDEISAEALGLDKLKAFDEKTGAHAWLMVRSQRDFQRVIRQPLLEKMNIKNQEEFEKRKAEYNKALNALTVQNCLENMGYKFDDSLKSRHPKRGYLAMANSGPNTNGSQFFINLIDTPWLTGKHTVFGRVIKGMDIVDKLGAVPVNPRSKPIPSVSIKSIRVTKNPPKPDPEPKQVVVPKPKLIAPANTVKVDVKGLTLYLPKTWKTQETTSKMRIAQYEIPAVEGDKENAELIVFYFGSRGAGPIDANLNRWIGQFAAQERATKASRSQSAQGNYVMINITGTYNKTVGPPIQRKTEAKAGSRMIGVIIDTSEAGPFYLKLSGPDKTVAASADAFRAAFGGNAKTEKPYELKK